MGCYQSGLPGTLVGITSGATNDKRINNDKTKIHQGNAAARGIPQQGKL